MPRELEVIGRAYLTAVELSRCGKGPISRYTPGCCCCWDSQKGQPSEIRLQLPFFACANARKASADGSQVSKGKKADLALPTCRVQYACA